MQSRSRYCPCACRWLCSTLLDSSGALDITWAWSSLWFHFQGFSKKEVKHLVQLAMSRRYVDNAQNRRLGRVGMQHGSAVVSRSGGGTRPCSSGGGYSTSSYNGGGATSSTSSQRCYVDNAQNRGLGRVGMPHGTAVVHQSGGGTASRSNGAGSTSTTSSQRYYVDNAQNRGLGRVGMPHGTAVVHQSGGGTASRSNGAGSTGTTSSQRYHVDNAQNRHLGRVGMAHGTAVVHQSGGGTASRSNGAGSTGTTSSQRYHVDNAQNRRLGRVGMPHGTAVVSRSGGGTTSRDSSSAVGSSSLGDDIGAMASNIGSMASSFGSGLRHYADVAYDRTLGRVNMPSGLSVESQSSGIRQSGQQPTASTSTASTATDGVRRYVDNPLNRRLGRVGKPIGTHVLHNSGSSNVLVSRGELRSNRTRLVSEYTIDDLEVIVRSLGLADPERQECQGAVDVLEQERVEEDWRRSGLEPVTDISYLSDHAPGQIIPYSELGIPARKPPIGHGVFGEVYAGRWRGTPIAYKKLLYQQMSRKVCDRFVREVSILALLNHPCTIRMFGAVVEDGNIGIVMEYMCRSLHRALHWDEESFSESKKKSMVDQIASALEYLHGNTVRQIAHCDVKPANILLNKDDNVKLTDFGISIIKNTTETSQSTAAAPPGQGTPRYSAPEVLRGELLGIEQLMQTDIYSLAVVVFEILSEEEPFFGLSTRQLEAQVGHGSLCPTCDDVTISPPVDSLLKWCWDRTADIRPSAAEFRDAWSTIRVLCSEWHDFVVVR